MIPSSINLFGTTYTVIETDLSDEDYVGLTEPDHRLITLHKALPNDVKLSVFWHEVGHAILEHTGVGAALELRQEEAVVQAYANALVYLMTANELPKLEGELK